ncbi:MAG: hypothetical protein JXQ97_13915 [Natronospirillum sp.]
MRQLSLRLKLTLGIAAGIFVTLITVIGIGWFTMQANGDRAVRDASESIGSLVEQTYWTPHS